MLDIKTLFKTIAIGRKSRFKSELNSSEAGSAGVLCTL